ncbi:leucine-rich repeat-containing protein [Cavenderia fasciculata]|uniref:Leucine-rich repeat-containing protein n=1 Tax=Cavenderia fasciculata TaxID=261658 RepID=F4Q2V4_CACFS|nr:leucine-rich repeat-containing protein [Cavenderia fasciculata]EGG16730.1 leucine-rich repeat-containing protein [Cavenderia fasciculata]|eukprot:XP_004355204.1 leucine-rich repeat-containing protein [Cavenderia fasciculata]
MLEYSIVFQVLTTLSLFGNHLLYGPMTWTEHLNTTKLSPSWILIEEILLNHTNNIKWHHQMKWIPVSTYRDGVDLLGNIEQFVEESLGTIGGLFGEENTHQVWVDANKSPTPSGSGFNKRLIVVGKYKLMSLKKGAFGKSIEIECHLYNISEIMYLDNDETIVIKYINPETPNDLGLGITCKASLEKLQNLVLAIRKSYRQITCGFPQEHSFKLTFPDNKLLPYDTPLVMSPANGFIDTYIAHSYFYKTVSTLDFIRYVESIVQNGSTELDFTQCPGIDPTSEISFNLFTAIVSLRHNTYFRSVDLSGLPHANIISALGMCLETNRTLTKLNISNLRIEQSFQPIATSLVRNSSNRIQMLDISKNSIIYPVMITLTECFSRIQHGLVSLDLSKCELQPRTVVILFESFERNFGMSLAMRYLNLSNNKMGDLGSSALASWMSKIKGYHNLENLGPDGDQLAALLAQFISAFPAVRTLNVAGGRYPLGKSLFPLLEQLVKNQSLREIDISENGMTDAMSSIIGEMLRANSTLVYLNIDENQFASLDSNSYVSEYANRLPYIVTNLPSSGYVPLVPVPDHLSALPPPPSPSAESPNSATAVASKIMSSSASLVTNGISNLLGSSDSQHKKTHKKVDSNGSNSSVTSQLSMNGNGPKQSVVQQHTPPIHQQQQQQQQQTTVVPPQVQTIQQPAASVASPPIQQQHTAAPYAVNSAFLANTSNLPLRNAPTTSSDWNPDETSEFEVFDSQSQGSFVNYSDSPSDNYSQSDEGSEHESSNDKRSSRKKKSIKNNGGNITPTNNNNNVNSNLATEESVQ